MDVGLIIDVVLIALMKAVLCGDWNVSLPKSIVGINGSCVKVLCSFEVPDVYDANVLNCSNGGSWRKGNVRGQTVLTSKNTENIVKGQIVGDVVKKSCTTLFTSFPAGFSDFYFFRIECPNGPKFSFTPGVHISFQSGFRPALLRLAGEVPEGVQLRLQCSVPVPCTRLPPTLSWLHPSKQSQEETQTYESKDGLITLTSTLTFTPSADHHKQNVTCSVSYPLTQGGSTELSAVTHTLHVLYGPRLTTASFSPSGSVYEGQAVTFTCASDANPRVTNYTWYKVIQGNMVKQAEGDTLVLVAGQQDGGLYLCEAQNPRGSHKSHAVVLQVIAADGGGGCLDIAAYVICGVTAGLYILTVLVGVCMFKRLTQRLKLMDLKLMGEQTYASLKRSNAASDYDQLRSKTAPPAAASSYENATAKQSRSCSQPAGERR